VHDQIVMLAAVLALGAIPMVPLNAARQPNGEANVDMMQRPYTHSNRNALEGRASRIDIGRRDDTEGFRGEVTKESKTRYPKLQ
jgi:hypothetical protein